MYNLINYTSLFVKKPISYSYLVKLNLYSPNSFIFNLYLNSFQNSEFKENLFIKNLLANSVSFNGFSFNDLDNKEFCCLFILTFFNIVVGFFPNTVFYFTDFYVSDLIFFINY
jgi:hypothetical protein